MSQSEIIGYISEKNGIPETQVSELFKSAIRKIVSGLSVNQDVSMPGLGCFEVKSFPGRRTVFFKQDTTSGKEIGISANPANLLSEPAISFFSQHVVQLLLIEKEISFPELGIFHLLVSGEENRISFTPSLVLRNVLNGGAVVQEIEPVVRTFVRKEIEVKPETEEVKAQELVTESADKNSVKVFEKKEETKEAEEVDEKRQVLSLPKKEEVKDPEKTEEKATVLLREEVKVIPRTEKAEFNEKNSSQENASIIDKPEKKENFRNSSQVGDVIIPDADNKDNHQSKKKNVFWWILLIIIIGLASSYTILKYFVTQEADEPAKEVFQPSITSSSQEKPANLLDLSIQHYGSAVFWVYIYESNKEQLSSPLSIPAGVELNIPDLQVEYNIDTSDSLEIRRANLRAEIILKQNTK